MEISVEKPSWWKQHQRQQQGDQSKQREACDNHKLQMPGLSCFWRGFQAWDTLQDSTDDSIIDKVETSMERQEHLSQLQGRNDALPYYIHLPVCLWIMDPEGRAAKKNTSHGTEMLAQDATHLVLRPRYQGGSLCQDPAGNRSTRRHPLTNERRRKLQWYGHVSLSSGLAKTILQGAVKG